MKRSGLLFLIESLNVGGSEIFLSNLLLRLDRTKFRPVVCCLVEKGKLAPSLEAKGLPVVSLDWKVGSAVSTAVTATRLARLLKKERIELVQTFFYRPETLAALAGVFVRGPLVVGSQYDVIVPKRSLSRLLLRASRLRVRHVVANCETCKLHREKLTGHRPADISVIYIGLPETEYVHGSPVEPVLARDFFEGGPVVTFAGRLYPLKGPDVFLRAAASVFRQNPRVRFLLVGDGPARDDLVLLAKQLGVYEAIHFVREVSSTREVFSKSSVVVSSSRSEGFPTVVLEAMGAGAPVAVSRVGGVEELVRDRADGFLFESEDSEGLASIVTMLVANRKMAEEAGANAREKVTKLFRFADTVKGMESLYARLLTGAGLGRGDDGNTVQD